jgi:hypothetical protein
VSVRESAHSDQANQAAVRRLIPPIPRPCSLAPSVTTLLYSTTVSQALRQTLRACFAAKLGARPGGFEPATGGLEVRGYSFQCVTGCCRTRLNKPNPLVRCCRTFRVVAPC